MGDDGVTAPSAWPRAVASPRVQTIENPKGATSSAEVRPLRAIDERRDGSAPSSGLAAPLLGQPRWTAVPSIDLLGVARWDLVIGDRHAKDRLRDAAGCNRDPGSARPRGYEPPVVMKAVVPPPIGEEVHLDTGRIKHRRPGQHHG